MPETPVRYITVRRVGRVTPRLARITFEAERTADLPDGADQQVKLYFPRHGQRVPRLPEPDADVMRWYQAFQRMPEPERPWMRSYTLRRRDTAEGTVDIDFVLHDHAGPATRWALAAATGDTIAMFGPSGYFARPEPIERSIAAAGHLLLVGDETALPAIGTILEALPPGHPTTAFLDVHDRAEEQRFDTAADLTVHWFHRDAGRLASAVRAARLPDGALFAWLAGEAGTVRSLRRHLVDRGVPKHRIEFAGYWRQALSQEDTPTADDLADARERLADTGLQA